MHTDTEKSITSSQNRIETNASEALSSTGNHVLKEESGTYGSAKGAHARRNDGGLEDSAAVLSRIKYLMASAPCTASQAMDMLGISPLDRSQYLAKL